MKRVFATISHKQRKFLNWKKGLSGPFFFERRDLRPLDEVVPVPG